MNLVTPSWRSSGFLTAAAALLTAAVCQSADRLALEAFDKNGIAFEYPSSWVVTTKALSNGVNPKYRFAVSTALVQRTPKDSGPCLPGIAAQLPRTGLLAYVREALGADRTASLPGMQPRPRSFRLPTRADNSLCGFGPGGRWVPFKTGGRAFYLGLYVGPRASSADIRALGRLVDGMTIDSR